ncbi:MAG: response regulator transcription factor [Acidobacteria bacterium]|nr:response regulator transcription factor [Acidobacteriota bacterium]
MSAEAAKKILIVDDDPHHCRIVSDLLTSEGYVVDVAVDSPMAVHKNFDFVPDLVLMDIMMPRYDGTTSTQALRELRPTLPIVIVSAKDAPADITEGMDWGATRYITKPFDPQFLLSTIRELLEGGA